MEFDIISFTKEELTINLFKEPRNKKPTVIFLMEPQTR